MNLRESIIACLLVLVGCGTPSTQNENVNNDENLAAEGFDFENSDPAAIQLADSVMKAMGGRANWDKVRFISWNFFGRRDLVWDKHTGRVRIESHRDSVIYLTNLLTNEGRVQVKGREIVDSDSLLLMLERARAIWNNDAYWLIMPFKLKDSGVTLKYLGEDTISNGAYCNVVQLTFKNVGTTPQNKYHVYIDTRDKLVRQWAYFESASQDTASAVWPMDNYKMYDGILLSADRSDGKGPKNVRVSKEMPEEVFTAF
jgi:hypothetical protein